MQDKILIKENEKWSFDEDVANVFDNMLERSIPQYQLMRELCKRIGFNFVVPKTSIVDIGCSNGNAIEPFVNTYSDNEFYLYDMSEPMIEKAKKRYLRKNNVYVLNSDITKNIIVSNSSVILSVLTIQFTPIEYRQKIISNIYNSLIDKGCFIFVEKVLGNTSELDDILVSEYYKIKEENSYTQKQIANKRKSLEGVLVPVTAKWNEELLQQAGFRKIDCFWRCLNFAGWLAIK